MNIFDIEEINNLKEEADADGNFYDYILVDKHAWKPDTDDETESTTIYKIRKTLQQHQENMYELIENYEKIKDFDQIASHLEEMLVGEEQKK